jgi:hypothetical protein
MKFIDVGTYLGGTNDFLKVSAEDFLARLPSGMISGREKRGFRRLRLELAD